MKHQHHQPGRTTHSELKNVPLPKHSKEHKKAVLFVGVMMSMLVIVLLYAASFQHSSIFDIDSESIPMWTDIKSDITEQTSSFSGQFFSLKGTVEQMLSAQQVKAESIGIMAEKINAAKKIKETEVATSTEETISETLSEILGKEEIPTDTQTETQQ